MQDINPIKYLISTGPIHIRKALKSSSKDNILSFQSLLKKVIVGQLSYHPSTCELGANAAEENVLLVT